MNRQWLTALVLGLLLLFIFSPFAALALLMVMLVGAIAFWLVASLLQGILTGSETRGEK
ncbi:MAG: hypothetical protein NW224_18065 [Leptolyngbyaceae cyanobacterium bins.302]|nr:hypothetical protein [Leptolyngbyaceae cyanobacterium bins.302]